MKRKIKNFVLKASAWASFIAFILSGCAIDTHSWIPAAVCGVAACWLALFGYANKERVERYDVY